MMTLSHHLWLVVGRSRCLCLCWHSLLASSLWTIFGSTEDHHCQWLPFMSRMHNPLIIFFLNYKVSQVIWRFVLGLFGFTQILRYSIRHLFKEWKMVVGSGRGRIMWQNSSLAIIWLLWKEGNSTCFEDKASSSDALPQKAKFNVAYWEFQGISIFYLAELAGDRFHFGLESPLLTLPLPQGLLSLTLMGVQQVAHVPQQVSALSTKQKWKLCGEAFK